MTNERRNEINKKISEYKQSCLNICGMYLDNAGDAYRKDDFDNTRYNLSMAHEYCKAATDSDYEILKTIGILSKEIEEYIKGR